MERYEVIQPGAAERIIAMAEAEQQSRHSLERTGLRGGLVLWALIMVTTVVLAWLGSHTAAWVVGSGFGLMMLDRFIRSRNG